MTKNNIFLILGITLLLSLSIANVSAFKISDSFKSDYQKVKEKWIYREDVTGGHRGFTLTHKFFLPREESKTTIESTPAESQNIITRNAFGSFGTGSRSYGSVGYVGSAADRTNTYTEVIRSSDRSVSQAFNTFNQNTGSYGGYRSGGAYLYGSVGYSSRNLVRW